MGKATYVIAAIMLAVTSGAGVANSDVAATAQIDERLPQIDIERSDRPSLPTPQSAGLVFVEFLSSSKLSALCRAELERSGYRVTEDPSLASTTVRFGSTYEFVKARERGVRLDFGAVFEGAADSKAVLALAEGGQLSRMHVNEAGLTVGVNAGLFAGGLINSVGASAGVLDAISNAAGIKGAFNRFVAGDARGFCLINCENWRKYRQTLKLTISIDVGNGEARHELIAKVIDEKLWPDVIFDKVMDSVWLSLLPSPTSASGAGS